MLLHGFIDACHPHLIWMAWSESPFAGSDFCLFFICFFLLLFNFDRGCIYPALMYGVMFYVIRVSCTPARQKCYAFS